MFICAMEMLKVKLVILRLNGSYFISTDEWINQFENELLKHYLPMSRVNIFFRFTFSANSRIFENVHALNDGRFLQTQLEAHFLDLLIESNLPEGVVQIVQRMADFIQGNLGIDQQFAVFSHSFLFEKITDFVGTVEEILVFVLKHVCRSARVHYLIVVSFTCWDSESEVLKIARFFSSGMFLIKFFASFLSWFISFSDRNPSITRKPSAFSWNALSVIFTNSTRVSYKR